MLELLNRCLKKYSVECSSADCLVISKSVAWIYGENRKIVVTLSNINIYPIEFQHNLSPTKQKPQDLCGSFLNRCR